MLRAICVRCGTLYFGWALKHPPKQDCPRCGAPLAMLNTGNEAGANELAGRPNTSPAPEAESPGEGAPDSR